LDDENRRYLGIVCDSKHGPHTLTYRHYAESRIMPTWRRTASFSPPQGRPFLDVVGIIARV
ncbi:MAG: hypothetical protein ACLPUG_18500, partial [Acidimicrobiales bacterium]